MADHLRYSGLPAAEQVAALCGIVGAEPVLRDVLERLERHGLPDCWLVSGAIYNTVWNVLSGRPAMTGIKDFDVFYFDDGDLSYEAEDVEIRRLAAVLGHLPVPAELRNQARVHLWYEQHFGEAYAPLRSSTEAIDRFASLTHAVGMRRAEGKYEVYAPFGLDHMFSFRLAPNRSTNNRRTHETKAARARAIWPELVIEPW